MPTSAGLSHVAMSVPEGTLTDEFRARLLEFYGPLLGWTEMESLRRPDRLTVSVGGSSYITVRERAECMVTHGYEHFGVVMGSAEHLQQLWDELASQDADVELDPLVPNAKGEGSFRFRFLLPMGGGSAVLRRPPLRATSRWGAQFCRSGAGYVRREGGMGK